jgi:small-conductance mechanosensitive channel
MFALASKEFIANLFGSLSLIFSKNFKIGDTIRVKGYEGVVDEISLSYTRLIDKKGTVIFMPNKLIISETVENLSMAPSKKLEFPCELPISDVKELKKALESIEKDIKKLGGDNLKISESIEGLTDKGCSVTIRIETNMENVSELRKDVWILLGERVRGE